MIVDFHAHVFPDAIAQKASDSIANFYQMPTRYDGTVSALLQAGAEAGIDHFVVHAVATSPRQTESVNDFIAGACRAHPCLTGFAAIHPDQPDIQAEVDRALGMGLKGVKIHSDMQRVNLDDPRLMALYEILQGRALLLAHAGDNRFDFSAPRRLARVLDNFPRLVVIGAHFGGWSLWEEALEALGGRDIHVDCSSSLYALTDAQIRKLVRGYGAERVLFGSDYPMWNSAAEIRRLRASGLTDGELSLILGDNARRLLGL
jgi:predicted TIM-barrel fold metal-dependent hydrolase